MVQKLPSINLVKKEKKDFLDTFLHWALTIGRVVVMLTEIIALSTFLYRFSLDRELIDLKDKIKQKQVIVNLLKENEIKYRDLQQRLNAASQLSDKGIKITKLFTDFVSFNQLGLNIDSITFSEKNVKINANATSLQTLSSFIANLKNHPRVNSVSLDKIENKISSAIIGVAITVTLKD